MMTLTRLQLKLKKEGKLQALSKKYFAINVFEDLDDINKKKSQLEVRR